MQAALSHVSANITETLSTLIPFVPCLILGDKVRYKKDNI
jgi:hypothetical protein